MKPSSHLLSYTFLGILCLTIVAAIVVTISFKHLPAAQAASGTDPTIVGPLGPDAPGYRSCIIKNVYVSEGIMMLVCTTAMDGKDRYAVEGGPEKKSFVDRMLVILNTGYALDQSVDMAYETNGTFNPPGCSTTNCRLLLSVELERP